jgi:hypothetical protein
MRYRIATSIGQRWIREGEGLVCLSVGPDVLCGLDLTHGVWCGCDHGVSWTWA